MSNRNSKGEFQPGHSVGAATRWQRGVSGNQPGLPAARRDFEQAFYEALTTQGSPDEAARLLWESARQHEPWAVQLLLQRLAPTETRVVIGQRCHEQDLIGHLLERGGWEHLNLPASSSRSGAVLPP
jgi:hypothetical protein